MDRVYTNTMRMVFNGAPEYVKMLLEKTSIDTDTFQVHVEETQEVISVSEYLSR